MHQNRVLIERRLERVLRERIRPAIYGAAVPLEVGAWHVPGEPVAPGEGIAAEYVPAKVGEAWGPAWGTTWFRLSGSVPPEWAGREVEAVVDLGYSSGPGFTAEGLAYRPDGTAIKGLHAANRWIPVDSGPVLLYVEAAANPLIVGPVTPMGEKETAGDQPIYRLNRADLAVFDRGVWELVQDFEVLEGLMHALSTDDPRRWEILAAVGRALDAVDLDDVSGSAAEARDLLAPALAVPAHAGAHRVSAVGHAHIDSAWLWPLRETVRKVARTVSNVTALMDDDPGFVFAMSQAQQYAWIKRHRPEVYARLKEKVAAGQFVPVGGLWVEADTNMPGGEALARQFSYGKRFFLEEFGIETEEVWLPDSFGYSAALPQLVRLSGSRWFLTQKISWNQTNRFPHHTFWWEGIDGSRVFTHFPPVDTYNAELSGHEMGHLVRTFAEKGAATRSLVPFGYGDGGGGPTREMLARAARLESLAGSARVRIEPPSAFFAAAEQEYPNAPVWVGELYLELHRATYTSQAQTKQGNRRSEHLLREAELWAATATLRTGAAYPYDALDRLWKTVLLHQFHDILPGSSIAWVHRQARETYAEVRSELAEIVESAQRTLAGDPSSGGEVVFNATPHGHDGAPALGAGTAVRPTGAVSVAETEVGWVLDNGLLRVTVDRRGLVTSAVDLAAAREMIPDGRVAGLLQLHPDLPNDWDAWDVDSFYRNRVTDLDSAVSVTLTAATSERAEITTVRSFGGSTVTQTVALAAGAGRLDFTAEVDWHEREKFLKVAFPLDVRTDRCAAETQFGHVYRPTHTNTSWDAAKFEICAHRWLHVGETGWGAALVNDSTYGHDVTRDAATTTVRLSLLRAPRFPDPETDQGVHSFRYALVPGTIADAVREGYRINLPERRLPGNGEVAPLVTVSGDQVMVESVKLADDRSGDVVVRLYESLGGRASVEIACGFDAASAREVDLLERPSADSTPVTDGRIETAFRPFQIRTFRFTRRPA